MGRGQFQSSEPAPSSQDELSATPEVIAAQIVERAVCERRQRTGSGLRRTGASSCSTVVREGFAGDESGAQGCTCGEAPRKTRSSPGFGAGGFRSRIRWPCLRRRERSRRAKGGSRRGLRISGMTSPGCHEAHGKDDKSDEGQATEYHRCPGEAGNQVGLAGQWVGCRSGRRGAQQHPQIFDCLRLGERQSGASFSARANSSPSAARELPCLARISAST